MLDKAKSCLTVVFVMLTLSLACEHQLGDQSALQPTFSSIQTNIFTPKCVNEGCHPGQDAPMSLQSGAAFDNLVNVPSAFEGGNLLRVNPNDANNSALYLKVLGDARTSDRMPLLRSALSQDEINAIRDWINNGAQNN